MKSIFIALVLSVSLALFSCGKGQKASQAEKPQGQQVQQQAEHPQGQPVQKQAEHPQGQPVQKGAEHPQGQPMKGGMDTTKAGQQ